MVARSLPIRSPAEALDALRRLPAAGPLLAALTPDDDAWLVGGATRDLLLGRVPRELDLLLPGPVEALAARLGTTVARHERFMTVEVQAAPGVRYDLARARTETYAHPGALPTVAPAASVADDLSRRDLSVNAIALSLRDGRVIEAPGAREDLAAGRLRVLHDRSFADDPTRIWRTARYAARLGFAVENATRRLAAAADPRTASGPRHGAELRLALGEPEPGRVLRTLLELNPRILPDGFDPAPPGLEAALALLPAGGRADLVRLAAGCAGVDLPALLPWLQGLGWTAAERDVVGAGSRASTYAPLRQARTPSQIQRAAAGVPDEVVALAGGENARRWFDEIRDVALTITGADLLRAGVPAGPELGARLRRALAAKLDGALDPALDDRDAELAAALSEEESRG